ncbi:MAG: hypothetical protein ACXVCO_06930 [Ktedonobacterales bacterium]
MAECALNLGMLVSIRLTAADPHVGDLCQGVLAIRHLLAHQNPYQPEREYPDGLRWGIFDTSRRARLY